VFKHLKGDKIIWGIVIALTLISVLVVYSSTESLAYKYRDGNTEFYVLKHFGIILFGLALMFISHRITYTRYSRIGQILLWVSLPLLCITLFYGSELNYARRWIELPLLNLSFQPADLAKLAMIMYTARVLTVNQSQIKDGSSAFYKIIIPLFLVCGLIAPADLSSAALLFFTVLLLMFIGRIRISNLMGSVFAEVWQAQQSKIAIATGGAFGNGPGHSEQSRYLPHPYSDFIYAIIQVA